MARPRPRRTATATREIRNIVFACDAGMGSSAMGASVLRKKIQDAGHPEVTVVNKAIANLDDSYDLVVSHQDLTDRARQKTPSAEHVSVDNFMASPALRRDRGDGPREQPRPDAQRQDPTVEPGPRAGAGLTSDHGPPP